MFDDLDLMGGREILLVPIARPHQHLDHSHEMFGLYTYIWMELNYVGVPVGIRMARHVAIIRRAGAAITDRIFWGQAGVGDAGLELV